MADEKTLTTTGAAKPTQPVNPTPPAHPTPNTPREHPTPNTPREAIEQERAIHPVISVAAHLPTDIDTPFIKAEPSTTKTETEAQKKVTAEKKELTEKIGKLLAEHGGNESAIPASSEYWGAIARLRYLSNP